MFIVLVVIGLVIASGVSECNSRAADRAKHDAAVAKATDSEAMDLCAKRARDRSPGRSTCTIGRQ